MLGITKGLERDHSASGNERPTCKDSMHVARTDQLAYTVPKNRLSD
jgi:hypothetical protein